MLKREGTMSEDGQDDLKCVCSDLPQLDFSTFVLSMSSSALVHLGDVPEPESGRIVKNIPAAKQTIDILCMLESKTRGNLTDQESRLLRDMLFELRMKYVQHTD